MTELEQQVAELLQPSDALVSEMYQIEGDIILLGVGGKMGPSMAKLAKHAADKAGVQKKIIGISRFTDASARAELETDGIETIAADLLNEKHLQSLPDAPNIIYLAGTKFGTTGKEPFTWAMNAYLPGRVAEKYKNSKIVAFSTGNVYPFSSVGTGIPSEDHPVAPIGEYGQSCLGRERIFQHFSQQYNIPTLIYRLNYAIDLKYGVLLELARSVNEGKPIDLSMGLVNVIWQGDANEIAIRALKHCDVPAKILNVTGPETISIKWLAEQFSTIFGKEPVFVNEPQSTSLLSNASEAHRLFGYPRVTLRQMIALTAAWLKEGGKTLNKPTHFQERKGQF